MSTYMLLAAGLGLGLLIALRGLWNLSRPSIDETRDDARTRNTEH